MCILGLLGHMVSVACSQLFCCNVKVDIDNMSSNEHGSVPLKLYLQKQMVSWVWSMGHSFLHLQDTEMNHTVPEYKGHNNHVVQLSQKCAL